MGFSKQGFAANDHQSNRVIDQTFSNHSLVCSIQKPLISCPLLIDSPHSGRIYPENFAPLCSNRALIDAEDNMVDALVVTASTIGATIIKAEFPRSYIDVNRAVNDIDLAMLDGDAQEKLAATSVLSEKGKAGAGLIRRFLYQGVDLYRHKLSYDEVMHRINHYYKPYHQLLQELTFIPCPNHWGLAREIGLILYWAIEMAQAAPPIIPRPWLKYCVGLVIKWRLIILIRV
jgi:hypothetical protein